jgi:cobalt-zinc-cadmium efflux system outer membrane protein
MPARHLAVLLSCLLLAGCGLLDRAPKVPQASTDARLANSPGGAIPAAFATAPDQAKAEHSSRRGAVVPAAFIQPVEEVPQPAPDGSASEAPSPAQWTLDEMEGVALANNPSLGEAWARVQAARGRWVQAGLPPNTVLGYSGQQLGSKGQAEQEGVFIGQNFVRLRKLRLSRAVAEQEIQMAEQQLAAQQHRVLTDVRLAYYEVLVAQRRMELTQDLLAVDRDAVQTAQALFDVQEVGQADVLRATVELQSAQVLLRTSRNQYEAAWSRLAAVLGMPQLAPQPLAGELTAGRMEISHDEALARLLAESPELAAALSQVERQRWALERALVEPLPDLDIQAIVQSDNATHSSNGAILATVPLPWLNRNQGGIREAESHVIEAERGVSRVELSLQRRLAAVFQRYASARSRVDSFTGPQGILENVRKTLELVRAAYRAGEISYIELLTAQRSFAQMNLDYVEALGELRAAIVEIDGLLLKDSLDGGQ